MDESQRPASSGRQEGVVVRKLIVSEFVSLDGVMEAPGGEAGYPHSGWVGDFMGPEQLQYKLNEVLEGESLLIGRVTYEAFAAAWPEQDGEPILVAGSRTLVHALIEAGLVDEFRFMVFPVILGSGRRVYPETPNKTVLELTDSETFPSGVTVLTYEPAS